MGQHPHKGFETVTIAYSGEVAHKDSSGGGGVVHQEFHSEEFSARGGLFEMVQLWVNLPREHKNTPPKYQHLANEDIPVVKFDGGAGHARLIAGEMDGVRGLASTFTPMNIWDIVINVGGEVSLNVPASHNLALVVLRGSVLINGAQTAGEGQLVSFEDGEGAVSVSAQGGEAKYCCFRASR